MEFLFELAMELAPQQVFNMLITCSNNRAIPMHAHHDHVPDRRHDRGHLGLPRHDAVLADTVPAGRYGASKGTSEDQLP